MKQELKDRLINNHTELFPEVYQYKTINVGDGWFPIVQRLLSKLKGYPLKVTSIRSHSRKLEVTYQVTRNIDLQVADNISQIINKYSKESLNVCNICGKYPNINKLSPNDKILCETHRESKSH